MGAGSNERPRRGHTLQGELSAPALSRFSPVLCAPPPAFPPNIPTRLPPQRQSSAWRAWATASRSSSLPTWVGVWVVEGGSWPPPTTADGTNHDQVHEARRPSPTRRRIGPALASRLARPLPSPTRPNPRTSLQVHPRVKAQQHVFAVATADASRRIGDWLIAHDTPDRPLYRRIIIPAEHKREFREKLQVSDQLPPASRALFNLTHHRYSV